MHVRLIRVIVVTYPLVAVPVAVIIVIRVVTIWDNRTKDEWSKVAEASVMESKIVEAGHTKTATNTARKPCDHYRHAFLSPVDR